MCYNTPNKGPPRAGHGAGQSRQDGRRKQGCCMAEPDNRQVVHFLDDHRAAIRQLIEQAYGEAGGHYAALAPAERTRQAETDSAEFIAALVRGTPDREAIQQTVGAAPATLAGDMVQMATALDRLFTAFVAERLQGEARLAQDLIRRSSYVIARFRLSVSSVQIATLLQREDALVPPAAGHRS